MADPQNEKERIAAKLARVRTELSDQSLLLRRNLDFGRHLSDSMRRHSWSWISIAAIFGWFLSRLPARKKKIYIDTSDKKAKSRGSGLSGRIWKAAWSVARPAITAYLTGRIAQKMKNPGAKWF
ncbi:MAG TPA: hypothetical protein VGF37_09280 [Chthoniobacterales bacterium]|jgi:hypothetical protein